MQIRGFQPGEFPLPPPRGNKQLAGGMLGFLYSAIHSTGSNRHRISAKSRSLKSIAEQSYHRLHRYHQCNTQEYVENGNFVPADA